MFESRRANTRCLLLGAATALAALVPSSSAWAAPPPPPAPGPVLVCQNGVCVYNMAGADSDSDGFSDDDEKLAGTDPLDPHSHPSVLDIIKLWRRGVTATVDMPFREVFVLPEKAPDGTVIGRTPLPDLPGRKDARAALGAGDAYSKVDASNGLRAVLDIRAGSQAATKDTPPPARVAGMDVRLIADVVVVSHSEEGGEVDEYFDKETGEKIGEDTTVHNAGGCTTSQTCTKEGGCSTATVCPPGNSMSDPDAGPLPATSAPGRVVVATPEQIAAFNLLRGKNTRFGATGVAIDPSAPPPSRDRAPIILVNPDDGSVWVSTQPTGGVPTNFNRFGGNINTGRPEDPQKPY